jgi:hypothetical protein
MYNGGIPEKRICEISGHRSLAVREYEETSIDMREKTSKIIQAQSINLLNKTNCSSNEHDIPNINLNGTFNNCNFNISYK